MAGSKIPAPDVVCCGRTFRFEHNYRQHLLWSKQHKDSHISRFIARDKR